MSDLFAPVADGRCTCPTCDGTGNAAGRPLSFCEDCAGEGRIARGRVVDCSACGSDALASVGLCSFCARQSAALEVAS